LCEVGEELRSGDGYDNEVVELVDEDEGNVGKRAYR
jgi:hypothetical protein